MSCNRCDEIKVSAVKRLDFIKVKRSHTNEFFFFYSSGVQYEFSEAKYFNCNRK